MFAHSFWVTSLSDGTHVLFLQAAFVIHRAVGHASGSTSLPEDRSLQSELARRSTGARFHLSPSSFAFTCFAFPSLARGLPFGRPVIISVHSAHPDGLRPVADGDDLPRLARV